MPNSQHSAPAPRPPDASLYPEVAAAGSLAMALERAAALDGADLGAVIFDSRYPHSAQVRSLAEDRDSFSIDLGLIERAFIVSGWSRGVELVRGTTSDLGELVRGAAAWRSGARVREIHSVAPFIPVWETAEAYEAGPAEYVETMWKFLLERLRHEVIEDGGRTQPTLDLAEAAFVVPELRQLLAFTSHLTLCFSLCTGYPYSWGVVLCVQPTGNGTYRLIGRLDGPVIREVSTASEAIEIVAANLPANCGPAVSGTWER